MSAVLNERSAAEYLGRKIKTLQAWRFHRKGPAYIKQGRCVSYLKEDLDAYLQANRIDPNQAA
ncbi:MAG: helix-turn-helix domain-containing protein [Desulfovibrionaceae bacterium]